MCACADGWEQETKRRTCVVELSVDERVRCEESAVEASLQEKLYCLSMRSGKALALPTQPPMR